MLSQLAVFAVADPGKMSNVASRLLRVLDIEHWIVQRVSLSHTSFCAVTASAVIVATADPFSSITRLRSASIDLPVIVLHPALSKQLSSALNGMGVASCRGLRVSPQLLRRDLERLSARRPSQAMWGGIWLDVARLEIGVRDISVKLTPHEFSIFQVLRARHGQTVPAHTLLVHMVGQTNEGHRSSTLVPVHIHNLRRKLARIGLESALVTTRGAGYALRNRGE